MDEIVMLQQECTVHDTLGTAKLTSADLYRSYMLWCETNIERPYSQRMSSIHVQHARIERVRMQKALYWVGVGWA